MWQCKWCHLVTKTIGTTLIWILAFLSCILLFVAMLICLLLLECWHVFHVFRGRTLHTVQGQNFTFSKHYILSLTFRDTSVHKFGWIFGKTPNGLWSKIQDPIRDPTFALSSQVYCFFLWCISNFDFVALISQIWMNFRKNSKQSLTPLPHPTLVSENYVALFFGKSLLLKV